MKSSLPIFKKPPVVEVALSVQFEKLDISIARLGTVWQEFRDRFPNIEDKPEIEPAFERFGAIEKRTPGVRFEVGKMPTPRLWFSDDSGNELVQVQRDRFIRNWRKTEDVPEYPSYEAIRKAFVDDWERFSRFVTEECKTELTPNQCEVTYVNIIENVDSGSMDKVVSCIQGTCSDDFLPVPEEAEVTMRFILKNESNKPWGRLHIAAAPAIRVTDNQPVFRLSLTARGAPQSAGTSGVMAALDFGHESVVRGFTSITTPEMHKVWERDS